MIPQTTVESVFPAALENYFAQFSTKDFLKTSSHFEILHKSQIGFLTNNQTADHVFTLRTLIDKYVDCHQTKVYMHVLSTLEKHLIRYGTLDFYTS